MWKNVKIVCPDTRKIVSIFRRKKFGKERKRGRDGGKSDKLRSGLVRKTREREKAF